MSGIREIEFAEPALLPGLCVLLRESVHGGASIGFLAPLAAQTAHDYWWQVMQGLGPALRLWIAEEAGAVRGAVQLAPCTKENGRHRAELQKLMVRSCDRNQGVATALLCAVEAAAVQDGISLLVLDTLRDTPAETFYGRRGWVRVGEIPAYAASPDAALHPTVFFYKRLGGG